MWILFIGGFSLVVLVVCTVSMNAADVLSVSVCLCMRIAASVPVCARLDCSQCLSTCLCAVVHIYSVCMCFLWAVCVSVGA